MNTPTILSIGAGFPQEEFVEALKLRNYNVISIGKGRNSQKVINMSDVFAEVNTHSFEDLESWINENNIKFDAAGSFAGGGAILTLQKINEKYNLPTRIPSELMVGMDKFSQQDLYEKYNLTSIQSWTSDEIKEHLSDDIEKYVVKPAVGRGSFGVEFISAKELRNRIESDSIPSDYIVQEFRTGIEYRMLMIVQSGELKLVSPVMRESYEGTSLLGRLSYADKHVDRIREYCKKMVDSLHLNNSIVKFDIMVSDKAVDMIEMDIAVGGGIYFKRYIEQLFEWDIINRYIDLILDIPIEQATIKNPNLVMDYVYNQTGKPLNIHMLDVEDYLSSIFSGPVKVVYNKLSSWESGKMETNADFIFTVIHEASALTDKELNTLVNDNLFTKWVK